TQPIATPSDLARCRLRIAPTHQYLCNAVKDTVSSGAGLPVSRMARIERIAIAAHGCIVTALLDALFDTGMATVAKALQLATDETVRIAVVRNNVIGARGGCRHTAGQAHGAQWVMHELQPRPSTPELRAMEVAYRFSPRRCSVQPRICVAL